MSEAPSAACRSVQKALVKRLSLSDTSTSCSPTSWKTKETKLRAAVAEVAVLKTEGRDKPHAASQEVDVDLQEVVTGAGRRELEEIQADAAAPAFRG
jgi:hypothetical protein